MKNLVKIVLAVVLAFSAVATFVACPKVTTYTIKYTIDGELVEGTPDSYVQSTAEIILWKPDAKKGELEFDGWYENADFTGSRTTYIPANIEGDKEFFGRYIQKEYKITYIIGDVEKEESYEFSDTAIALWEAAPPQGFALDGWYINEDFSGNIVSQIPAQSMGDRVFYGRYIDSANMFNINYIIYHKAAPDGEIVTSKSNRKNYKQSANPIELWTPPVDPNKIYFDGWYSNENFEGEKYTELPALASGHKIFYGKLSEPDSYNSGKVKYTMSAVKDTVVKDVNVTKFYGEKPVVIMLWQTTCVYCVAEMRDINALYKEMGDKIEFMIINVGQSYETVKTFMDTNKYTVPYYFDFEGVFGERYELAAKGMPVMITVDLWGYENSFDRGYPNKDEKLVKGILKEKFERTIAAANYNF